MSCDGRCCAVFNYPTTPAQLRERSEGYTDARDDEDRFLADMLIALSPEEAQERALRFNIEAPENIDLKQWTTDYPTYTCRHWDEDTRLCRVYEQRPGMCREYPYNRRCDHGCGCRAPTEVRTKWAAIEVKHVVAESLGVEPSQP